MASPVSDSYNVVTGGTIRGGRFSQGAAPPVAGKYRYQHPQLFQTARAAVELSHLPGGDNFSNETFGPTYYYINKTSGWAWDVVNGDWLDSTLTRHGSSPWFSVLANTVSGSTAVAEYTANCTTALQFIQSNARWNAFMVRCPTAPRTMAGVFSTTHPKPVIEVTYVGGATAVLACKIVARIDGSTSYPTITQAATALPLFIEFERPTAAVQSATIRFTITQHWSGSTPTIGFFVIDPPVNTDVIEQGIASASGVFDSGLVSHPNIIGVHRYLDGTVIDSFKHLMPGVATSSESSFDPAIFNNGATDLTKYPHAGLGKWINARSTWSIVDSTYALEGFEPLANGLGALRVPMPVLPEMADGFFPNGYGGTSGASERIYMPEPLFGNLDHIFVRHYMRIGTPNGQPYRMPIAKRYQMRQTEASALIWADCAGKMGITPAHETTLGGNTAGSGGGYGWQQRLGWADCTSDETGPDVEGWSAIWHAYDFAGNNPVGHRYGSDERKEMSLSQRGGLGTIYADKWYCIEMELKLNTVMVDAPGYMPDGEIRVWIDGRLAFERVGMVFRSLPLMGTGGANPPYEGGKLRPCRQLGVTGLWFNWYHGGLTQNTTPRTTFITGLAYGTSYIGPMQLTGNPPTLPAWVPQPNNLAAIPEVNTFASVYPGDSPAGGYSYSENNTYMNSASFLKIINDYSGGVYNPYYGTKGSMLFHGGGHSAANWNGIVAFDLATLTYSVVLGGSLDCYPADRTNGEYADGQAQAPHSYDMLAVLGPEAGYPLGALFTPVCMAGSYESGASSATHIFDFANPSLKWVRKSAHNASVSSAPGGACAYDKDLARVWWVNNINAAGYQAYFDLATNAHVKITMAYAISLPAPTPDSQCLRYDSARRLLICADTGAGTTVRRIWYFNTLSPSSGWTRATLSMEFPSEATGIGFAFDRQPDGRYVCYSRGSLTKLYRLTVPDAVGSTWTVEEISYTGAAMPSVHVLGKRWSYVAALESFVCKFTGAAAHQIYRP